MADALPARAFAADPSKGEFYGGPMSDAEVNTFLEGRWLIKLAVLKQDGWPDVVPMWYHWDASAFWVVGRKRSRWIDDLKRDPRCGICIEELEPIPPEGANRKILAQCTAEIVEGPTIADGSRWAPIAALMAKRYMGTRGVSRIARSETWERYLVRLLPREGRLRSWQGIDWAPRFFDPGQRPDFEAGASR